MWQCGNGQQGSQTYRWTDGHSVLKKKLRCLKTEFLVAFLLQITIKLTHLNFLLAFNNPKFANVRKKNDWKYLFPRQADRRLNETPSGDSQWVVTKTSTSNEIAKHYKSTDKVHNIRVKKDFLKKLPTVLQIHSILIIIKLLTLITFLC